MGNPINIFRQVTNAVGQRRIVVSAHQCSRRFAKHFHRRIVLLERKEQSFEAATRGLSNALRVWIDDENGLEVGFEPSRDVHAQVLAADHDNPPPSRALGAWNQADEEHGSQGHGADGNKNNRRIDRLGNDAEPGADGSGRDDQRQTGGKQWARREGFAQRKIYEESQGRDHFYQNRAGE